MIRRQLPAYSPLTPGRLALAAWDAIRSPERAREQFRAYLREKFGAPEAVLLASGTHALQLALEVAMAKRRGLVALPAYSCYDIVTAAVGAKVEATFYDIDPVSLSPDMQSLAQALEAGATTVVAGNLYGFPLDWDAIRAACDAHGAFLIEDAAQGLGSGWRGRSWGTFGDLTVLSFGRGKGWTGGGGGALLVRSKLEGAARLRVDDAAALPAKRFAGMRAAVLSWAQWVLGRPSLYGLVAAIPGTGLGETTYKEPTPLAGMPAFCAAAARRHVGLAEGLVEGRRMRAGLWLHLLEGSRTAPRVCVPLSEACGYLRWPTLISTGATQLVSDQSLGIGGSYPRPIAAIALGRLPAADDLSLAGAKELSLCLVALPTHPMVAPQDTHRVVRSLGVSDPAPGVAGMS